MDVRTIISTALKPLRARCRRLPASLEGYTKGAVTQNVGEKGVNSVLDYVSSSNDLNLLKGFYEQTLGTLR